MVQSYINAHIESSSLDLKLLFTTIMFSLQRSQIPQTDQDEFYKLKSLKTLWKIIYLFIYLFAMPFTENNYQTEQRDAKDSRKR